MLQSTVAINYAVTGKACPKETLITTIHRNLTKIGVTTALNIVLNLIVFVKSLSINGGFVDAKDTLKSRVCRWLPSGYSISFHFLKIRRGPL